MSLLTHETTKQALMSTPKRKDLELSPIDESLKGVFMWVNKTELTIPWDEYQRDRTNSSRAKEIAISWNWVAVGTLIVILRADRSHIVADGGTRLSAAKMRPDISDLPCMVHEVESAEQEAEIFLWINVHRDRLRVAELQHAELCARADIAVSADRFMTTLKRGGVSCDSIEAIRAVLARKHAPSARKLLPLLCELGKGRLLSRRVLKGLVSVEGLLGKRGQSLTEKPYLNRLRKKGLHDLENAIAGRIPPKTGGSQALYVEAICNTLGISQDD